MRQNRSTPILIRLTQIVFFIIVALIAANVLSSSSLHAVCPLGGVTSIYEYLTGGGYVQRIRASSFVIMWIVFLLAIPFGALFCGWICPLGSVQEWFAGIGKKTFKERYNRMIPNLIDEKLRYLRYVVLAWVLIMTAATGQLEFADVCPYDALFNSWTGNAAIGGMVVLGVILALSLFIERPFCKYACPYGALLGFFNRIPLVRLKRNEETCIDCKQCDEICPMNLDISTRDKVTQHQCIRCMKCTSQVACPVEGCMTFEAGNSSFSSSEAMRPVSAIILTLVIAVLFTGGISLTQSLGYWRTTADRSPARIAEGEFEGAYDPADIRGNFVFAETSQYFDIPLKDLAQAFEVPESIAGSIRHSDLEDYYYELDEKGTEIGNGSVKWFVALYTGVPYELDEPTYLLPSAVDLLEEKGTLTEEQLVYIRDHRIEPGSYDAPDWEKIGQLLEPEQESDGFEVKGNTTFQDVLNEGVSLEDLEEIVDAPITNTAQTIQSFTIENDMSFGSIKTSIETLLQ